MKKLTRNKFTNKFDITKYSVYICRVKLKEV